MHKAVQQDIAALLQGKSFSELCVLQTQVTQMINSGAAADPEYWEAVQRHLIVYKARAKLKEIHIDLLKKKLILLEEKKMMEKEQEDITVNALESTYAAAK